MPNKASLVTFILALLVLIGSMVLVRSERHQDDGKTGQVQTVTKVTETAHVSKRGIAKKPTGTFEQDRNPTLQTGQDRNPTLQTTIDTLDTRIDLTVQYNEDTQLFDVDADVTTIKDSVNTTITQASQSLPTLHYKPAAISLIGGISPAFKITQGQMKLSGLSLDAGLRLLDKWDISAMCDVSGQVGVRVGVRF